MISSAVDELKQFASNTRYTVPKMRFIAEGELDNFLYKQTPAWNESIIKTKSHWLGFQDHTFVEYYNKWIDWYWTNAPKEIELRLFSGKSNIEKTMEKRKYSRRQIKFFKKKNSLTATTWICGDYIIMIITNERPHYAIEIRNAELAKNQYEIFKELWRIL